MDRIVDLALRNRFLVLAGTVLAAALGVWSMFRLPIDAVPDVTPNQVMVLTQAPGIGPAEVEQFVTVPVETAMSGLPGITAIRSVSRFGLSSVYVYFEESVDLYFARRLVLERLPEARELIPDGYGAPTLGPISTGSARSTSSRSAARGTRPWTCAASSTGTSGSACGRCPASSR